jgi:hypothetical protein
MAKKQRRKADSGLTEWALMGAKHRLQQLVDEAATIFGHFPSLRTWAAQNPYPWMNRGKAEARAEPAPGRRRRRRTMTAAQKKAVSARMKKYWAARRKSEAK